MSNGVGSGVATATYSAFMPVQLVDSHIAIR